MSFSCKKKETNMNNQESSVENYGNVMNELESVEVPTPLADALNIPHHSIGLTGNHSSSSYRAHYQMRIDMAVQLASIRSEQ